LGWSLPPYQALFLLRFIKYPAITAKDAISDCQVNIDSYKTANKTSYPQGKSLAIYLMPAAFINDTEEDILKLDKPHANKHLGGSLCFFHSKGQLRPPNFEGKKNCI